MAENIAYGILDGILPALFVFSDAILYYIGITSKFTNLIIAVVKLAFALGVTSYLGYLYFYKKQYTRETNTLTDFIIGVIIIAVLIVVIALISTRVHNERITAQQQPVPEQQDQVQQVQAQQIN